MDHEHTDLYYISHDTSKDDTTTPVTITASTQLGIPHKIGVHTNLQCVQERKQYIAKTLQFTQTNSQITLENSLLCPITCATSQLCPTLTKKHHLSC